MIKLRVNNVYAEFIASVVPDLVLLILAVLTRLSSFVQFRVTPSVELSLTP